MIAAATPSAMAASAVATNMPCAVRSIANVAPLHDAWCIDRTRQRPSMCASH